MAVLPPRVLFFFNVVRGYFLKKFFKNSTALNLKAIKLNQKGGGKANLKTETNEPNWASRG